MDHQFLSPADVQTPLRRSRIIQRIQTPPVAVTINDDDAERRQSRLVSEASDNDTSTLTVSAGVERDGLLGCLKIYNENKINKSNAWKMSLIDNFASLVHRHHKSMRDFHLVGTTLEASCKIYGLRVDSVHADVINMVTGLCKMTPSGGGGGGSDNEDGAGNDDNGAANADGDTSTATGAAGAAAAKTSAAAARRAKRQKAGGRCTLVKTTNTINAKLETYARTEPTFAKLNTTIGDINSSKRLLNYVLTTVDSEVKHRSNLPFWDSADHPVCVPQDDDNYGDGDGGAEAVELVQMNGLNAMLNPDLVLRSELHGYRVTNAPAAEDFDDDDDIPAQPPADIETAFNQSHIDLAFDINAEVAPIDASPAFAADIEYMETGFDNDELAELDDNERQAICAVRSLRRTAEAVDDLRPVDPHSSQLEYSYRPLEKISRFWAGPSYWKIHKPRATSINHQKENVNADGTVTVGVQQRNQRRAAGQRRARFVPIEFVDAGDEDDAAGGGGGGGGVAAIRDDPNFISVRSAEAQKLRKINIYKRWDPKKLRLPTNLHLDRDRYDTFFYAPGKRVEWSKQPRRSLVSQAPPYDYNNADDREYCSNMMSDGEDAQSPVPPGGLGGAGGAGDKSAQVVPTADGDDHHHGADGDDDDDNAGNNASGGGGGVCGAGVAVIGTEFAGRAPESIEKIDIPFARRAKVVDMKQLKRCCLTLIDRQRQRTPAEQPLPACSMWNVQTRRLEPLCYECGAARFRQTLSELPAVLSGDQRASMSTATAFYSILHLANEQQLDLISIDQDDFYVRQRQKPSS